MFTVYLEADTSITKGFSESKQAVSSFESKATKFDPLAAMLTDIMHTLDPDLSDINTISHNRGNKKIHSYR